MVKTAAEVWRKYQTDGVPASGPNSPDKSDILAWGTWLETVFGAGLPGLAFATRAALNADLDYDPASSAFVYADATAANNGVYVKSGASGTGAWSRISDLPNSLVRLTVTGGTGDAIVATAPETPTLPGNKLYLLVPGANNTTATTIAVNGAAPAAIKNALGASLAENSLLNASPVLMLWSVDHYQLIVSVPVDATGVLADAQAAAISAAASAAAAAVSAASLGSAVIDQPISRGRLTLTSGVAVTTTDVVGATSVYFTAGPHITCDATKILTDVAAEATLALDSNSGHTGYHQSGKNFFVFRFDDGGVKRIGTGPAWTSDTAVGTGAGTSEVHLFGNTGEFTNVNSIALRFGSASGDTVTVPADRAVLIGGFRTTADGVTEDSAVKRLVSNLHNPMPRKWLRQESAASWTWSTASYHQVNANAANQVEYFSCFGATSCEVAAKAIPLNSTATLQTLFTGIGLDSTSVNSRSIGSFQRVGNGTVPTSPCEAFYKGDTQPGYHRLVWLEKGAGADTQTWFGVSGSDYQSGLFGSILN